MSTLILTSLISMDYKPPWCNATTLFLLPYGILFSYSYVSFELLGGVYGCGGLRFDAVALQFKFQIVPYDALCWCDAQGFCGVRFNPYLWAEGGAGMKDDTGLALYRKAGDLGMPVGVMCFKGLDLHVKDIVALLESSPQTKVRLMSRSCSPLYLLSIAFLERVSCFFNESMSHFCS